MENKLKTYTYKSLNALAITSVLLISAGSLANENPSKDQVSDQEVEKELTQVEQSSKKKLQKSRNKSRYKKVTISEDKSYYTIDGREELGPNPVDGETFFVEYDKKKYEGEFDYNYEDEEEDENFDFRIRNFNDRDGFYLAYSAVSSSGDDFYQPEDQSDPSFETHFSYRLQIMSLFVESPGLNSRRLHGLYATNAWGINFYNNEHWSLDIYKQTDTEKVEGLSHIQSRNVGRRAGIRATGYFDSSQLQFIYSPYNDSDIHENGLEASVSYTRYWQVKNWNVYGSLGAQYQSKEIVDFYQPDLVADDSRINTSAELGFEYALNKDWVLGAFASYSKLPSQQAATDEATTGTRAGLLLTFVF